MIDAKKADMKKPAKRAELNLQPKTNARLHVAESAEEAEQANSG
jgi:hypothetical protein